MQQQRSRGIVRIATKYGLIQGVLSFAIFLLTRMKAGVGAWPGAGTLLLIVLLVLAHWEFKRTHDGAITYPQALGAGTLLSGVGAAVSSALMWVYLKYVNTAFLAAVMQGLRARQVRQGITGTQAQHLMVLNAAITTPVWYAVTWLIIGALVGFVVALIVSIFTQKARRTAMA